MAEKGERLICLLEGRGIREGALFELRLQEGHPEGGGGGGRQGEGEGMKRKEGRGGMGTWCNPG